MRTRSWRRLVALLMGLWLGSLGGAADIFAQDRHPLMREDLGYVHAHAFGDETQTDATITAALASIGASVKTLMLTPGTWTIANDLTIPANVDLVIPSGATVAINTGRTLTINGTIPKLRRSFFTGAGSVVFGPKVDDIYPEWFGALCDDATNDHAALTRTMTAASASGRRTVRLPAATCRITSALTVPLGVGIEGDQYFKSIIRVVGSVKGLIYEGANESEIPHVYFRRFSVIGDVAHTLDLFTVRQAWNVSMEGVRLRGSSQNTLVLEAVPNFAFRYGEIGEFRQAGIYTADWTNGVTIEGNRFEDFGTAHRQAAITLSSVLADGNWNIRRNVFESNTNASLSALWLDGAHTIAFENNYAERYNHHIIVAKGRPSSGISIRSNYLHTFAPHKLDFQTDNLAHANIVIELNGFAGLSGMSKVFLPGNTLSYRFLSNTGGPAPLEWVAGYPATSPNVIKEDRPVLVNGIALGDWTRLLALAGNAIHVNNAGLAGDVIMNAGAGGGSVLMKSGVETAATFDAHAVAGNLTRLNLWDIDRGVLFRVKLGPNDSGPGGTGRALYIDNHP